MPGFPLNRAPWGRDEPVGAILLPALVMLCTFCPAALAGPAVEPSVEARAGILLLHEGRFDAAEEAFTGISSRRPEDPEGPFFEAFVTWWRLLDGPKDPDRVRLFEERLQEGVRRAEALLPGPEAQRGRILAGTALILAAQSRAWSGSFLSAGSAARQGHRHLEAALEADSGAADAWFALGAYKYFAARMPWLVRALGVFFRIPGGNAEEGLSGLIEASRDARYFAAEAGLLLAYIYSSEHEDDYGTALGHLRTLRAREPASPLFAALDARLNFFTGHLAAAESAARQAIALSSAPPAVTPDIPALARLRLAQSLYYQYRPREALEELMPLLEPDSHLPEGYGAIASALDARLRVDLTEAPMTVAGSASAAGAATASPFPAPATTGPGPGAPAGAASPPGTGADGRAAVTPTKPGSIAAAAPLPNDPLAAAAVERLRDGAAAEAAAALAAATGRNPGDLVLRYHLARAYEAAGRRSEAMAELRRCLEPKAGLPRTLQGWALIRLGAALEAEGKWLEAEDQYRRAASLKGFPFRRAAQERLRHPGPGIPPEG